MLRTFLYLVATAIVLAVVRNLVRGIGHILARTVGANPSASESKKEEPKVTRKLVQDPHTGTYIDPANGIRAAVGNTIHYFESTASRDAFLRSRS